MPWKWPEKLFYLWCPHDIAFSSSPAHISYNLWSSLTVPIFSFSSWCWQYNLSFFTKNMVADTLRNWEYPSIYLLAIYRILLGNAPTPVSYWELPYKGIWFGLKDILDPWILQRYLFMVNVSIQSSQVKMSGFIRFLIDFKEHQLAFLWTTQL